MLRDGDPYAILFPTGRRRLRLHWNEIRSAVGLEGLVALATYTAAIVLLATGLWVSIDTWADRQGGVARFPLVQLLWFVDEAPAMNLRPFWVAFLVAFGLVGWILSGQVTKRCLRTFVVLALVVMTLLLVTIGRNGNFENAAASARADARRLLESEQPADPGDDDVSDDAEPPSAVIVRQWLLVRLCEEAGLDAGCNTPEEAEKAAETVEHEVLENETLVRMQPLNCLQGWTIGSFDNWLQAASFDRRIVALRAVASCEIGAPDPASDTPDDPPAVDVTEVIIVPAVTTTVASTTSLADEGAETGADTDETPSTSTTVLPDSTLPTDDTPPDEPRSDPSLDELASQAVVEALRVQRSEVRAHEAIALGADELLSFASGPTHFAEFRFSGLAWLVLLGLVFVWYRHLEIRAGRHRLGPVDVEFESVDGSDPEPSDRENLRRRPATPTEALFKESVIRNVPEPGAVPGGGALAPVGDLVAESDLPHSTIASSVIELAQRVFATKGGYTVTCSVRAMPDGCAVFVRLRDTRTGNHLTSQVFEHASTDHAARLAGYWIAGWIISRSAYVPAWAQWSEDDAANFVNSGWIQGSGLSLLVSEITETPDEPSTVNSMILAQRAYRHQIGLVGDDASRPEGRANHLAALEDFARAVNRRPRFPVARYRRGVVLGTMMLLDEGTLAAARGRSGPAAPGPDEPPTGTRLHYLFGDLVLGTERDAEDDVLLRTRWIPELLDRGTFAPAMRRRMLAQTAEWANENRAALRWHQLARLRPSERSFWKSFSRGALESDWTQVLDLERCMASERLRVLAETDEEWSLPQHDPRVDRLEALRTRIESRALEPDSHWQLSYNLACFHSLRFRRTGHDDDRTNALQWLERALDRPFVAQLVREWIEADDDLAPLRELDDFAALARRVSVLQPAGRVDASVEAQPV